MDYVAVPTPDHMLTEMFNELDFEKEGSVEFDVFLARMSFKIQNRFSSDHHDAQCRDRQAPSPGSKWRCCLRKQIKLLAISFGAVYGRF